MYAKCSALSKAKEVFHELPLRNISTWNALLAAYAQQGLGKEALECFFQMQSEGLSPDAVTYGCTLKACGIMKEVEVGKQIHDEILSRGLFQSDLVLGTALVDMYAKCSLVNKAREVLDELPVRNVVSWSALIAGYVQQGQSKEAIVCYDRMLEDGLSPDAMMYACILKACGIAKNVGKGKQIHEEITSQGLLETDVVLGSALVDMYAKCGAFNKARQVLDELPVWNVVSWSGLIAGYVQQGQCKEAMVCYHQMRHEGLSPDAITYTCILKACSIAKEVEKGKLLHEEIASQGLLGKDVVVGAALVDMYAQCGVLMKARQIHDELPFRNVVSWSGLITGYVQQGKCKEALVCYDEMRREGLSPNAITYTCILKACGIAKDVDKGKKIHEEIANQGILGKDVVLGSALVDMYAKWGMLNKAQEVLNGLSAQNVVSWSGLIAGHVQQGKCIEAMACYNQMQREGVSPDAITYICILKACGIAKEVDKGQQIHEEVATQGILGKHVDLGTALVGMYAKCGLLNKAKEVLDKLPVRNVVSWSELIAGYIQQGQSMEAMVCYDQMRREGFSPQALTYILILKACGIAEKVDRGKQIHEEIAGQGLLGKDVNIGTALVDMYAKCRMLSKARQVLDELPVRNIVSWAALIGGYIQQGQSKEVLVCYDQMLHEGLSPDIEVYICILKACAIVKDVDKGKQIHEEIYNQGLLDEGVVLGIALVEMYANCGLLTKARQVLDELPVRETVSWTAIIAGYMQHGQGKEAIDCYEEMHLEGLFPDPMSYTYILKSCGIANEVDKGKRIHEEIASQRLLETDAAVCTALIEMYAKCGVLNKAREVLDELSVRNVVSWSALIAGYIQQGQSKEAMVCYHQMQCEGISPNAITYACILKACGIAKDVEKGEKIHEEISSQGLLEEDVVLGTALVDMYANCGLLTKARQVLDELPVRDVVSWNALIAGYVQQEQSEKALVCYDQMRREGLSPDAVTYASLLMACGTAKEVDKGKQIHEDIATLGLLAKDVVLGTTLVDMYAKCGLLTKAREVLHELPVWDLASWSALMAGYAREGRGEEANSCFEKIQTEGLIPSTILWNILIGGFARQGESKKALECFHQMQCKGFSPDATTLGCVLNACSHTGLVDECLMFFNNMEKRFGIIPNIVHHGCMVHLFGRTGHFDKAMRAIEKVPPSSSLAVWPGMLGTCRKWGNVKIGRLAFEHAIQMNERNVVA